MLKTSTFPISQSVFRCDHSPYSRMIWIRTTNLILFRRPQLRIAVLLVEGKQRVSPFYRDFQNDVVVFTSETCLKRVRSSLRANNGFLRSIIHLFIRFPLLRSFIIVPFWVTCWVRAFNESVVVALLVTCATANNGFPRCITFLNLHAQRTLTFVTSLPRAFWCRRWQSWGSPCNQTHPWSWLCGDSFFTWFFLRSFWHHFRTICRTEMVNVKQTQRMIPFVTCEISLG